jgi:phospholipid/cholesterol/gamma-HCH transport system substrate-binding protein
MAAPKTLTKALLVGALVAITGTAAIVGFTFFQKGGYAKKDSYTVFAYFNDASGLTWKSRIQIAGIQVGEVESVKLVEDRARLTLRLKNEIVLRADGCLTKKLPSPLLPDAILDLALGTSKEVALNSLPEDRREVKCINETSGFTKVFDSLGKVAGDIQSLAKLLVDTVGGAQGSIKEIIENLNRVSRSIDKTIAENNEKLSDILDDARSISHDVRGVTSDEKEHVKTIVANAEAASKELRQVLDSVNEILGTNKGEMKQSVEGIRQALEKVNKSLDDVEKVTTAMKDGKGLAGRLVSDEHLASTFAKTIDDVSGYVGRLINLQTQVRLRSEFLLNQAGAKTYFGVRLIPKPDKYYLIEVVDDPRGSDTTSTDDVEKVTKDANGNPIGTERTTTTTISHAPALKVSLQLAKRWGFLTARGGVIESSGGIGADFHFLDDTLQLSAEMFQFTRGPDVPYPRAKIFLNYAFLNHLFVTAGADDFLNTWRAGRYPLGPKFSVGRDVFFGGGLYFTDDDLKALLTTVGSSLGSLPK